MSKYNILLFCGNLLNCALVRKCINSPNVNKIYIVSNCKKSLGKNPKLVYLKLESVKNIQCVLEKYHIDFSIVFYIPFNEIGLVNYLKYKLGVPTIGMTKYWRQLENHKYFGKKCMLKNDILTPAFDVVKNKNDLQKAINKFDFPLVIKQNGLQGGMGVHICKDKKEAYDIALNILEKERFCLAEKFIKGEELTIHFMWDGNVLRTLEPVRDYKKYEEGNKGINTSSLGSYVPVQISDKKKELIKGHISQLQEICQRVKPNFTGIFVTNILLTEDKLYTLEFNMRPGTPEFETLLEHMDIDIVNLFHSIAFGELNNFELKYKNGITCAVNVVHKLYGKKNKDGDLVKVKIPENFLEDSGKIKINHYLMSLDEENIAEINPSIVVFSLLNHDEENPFPAIYEYVSKLDTKEFYYRRDLGEN